MHNEASLPPAGVSRRQFLKLGFWSGLALATVSSTALLSGCSSSATATGFRLLRADDLALFRALIPVVLAGALPDGAAQPRAIDDTLQSLDQLLFYTSRSGHRQVQQLFDLLNFPASRLLVAGQRHDWSEASAQDVDNFLQRWKGSRIGMLRSGYKALCQMLEMSWYLQPQSWPAIGYAPPTKSL